MLVFALPWLPAWLCEQSDYEARNYDVKKANGYWQLGRLGPEETEELQAKVRHSGMGVLFIVCKAAASWHKVATCGCAALDTAAGQCSWRAVMLPHGCKASHISAFTACFR